MRFLVIKIRLEWSDEIRFFLDHWPLVIFTLVPGLFNIRVFNYDLQRILIDSADEKLRFMITHPYTTFVFLLI